MLDRCNGRLAGIALAMATAGVMGQPSFAAPGGTATDGLQREIHLLSKDENDVVIKVEELPQVIRDYLAKEMPDAKVTEARKDFGNEEHTGDKFTYEVDVTQAKKEYELKFDHDGKLLKKREEAGDDANDTK